MLFINGEWMQNKYNDKEKTKTMKEKNRINEWKQEKMMI